jgi:hypothetical protein
MTVGTASVVRSRGNICRNSKRRVEPFVVR